MQLVNDLPQLTSTHPITNEKCLSSSQFTFNSQLSALEDDGAGNIRIIQVTGTSYVTTNIIGRIDYTKGIINLQQFKIDSYEGSEIRIYVRPKDKDITVSKINILSIEPSGINLTINAVNVN